MNNVVQGGDSHLVTFEYARTYFIPGPTVNRKSWPKPVWTLFFCVVGNGNTYEPHASDAVGSGQSVAFHTYIMPTSGKIRASWFHSHAREFSELWILDRTRCRRSSLSSHRLMCWCGFPVVRTSYLWSWHNHLPHLQLGSHNRHLLHTLLKAPCWWFLILCWFFRGFG